MAIVSQQVAGTAGATTGDMWTADTFGSDQFSSVQVTSTQLSGGQWVGPAVRLQGNGQNGYLGIYYWNNGSPELVLYKRTSGSWSQLGSPYSTGPLAAGTTLELAAVGGKISFLVNGVQDLSVTDTSFTGGAPGVMAYGSGTADNWSGGTTGSYSVGGSVSGLSSGTVVLQDNGGDNLSVSANGSFTFATSLAGGVAYSVTVKTNPSGQACTVSGGSGTVGSADVTGVAVACAASSPTASDDFNRADGDLGPDWTATADGGMAIVSQQVAGTAGATTGDMWTADTFGSDQFSSVQVTSTQLSGGQWVGPAVRLQGNGQNGYLGIYYWNNGSPELVLYKRTSGSWSQLGSPYSTGPLAAGTTLELAAVGGKISFLVNGVQDLSVTDTSFTGGAPGVMAYGSGTADNWSGGTTGSYSVGGSVSGLSSGTVVLQDNGGDNLSVSANGSFTFATSLAGGVAYSVTVKTNPSGQACTVSGGSGTVGSADVTGVAVACAASSPTASDDFNRADGDLGPDWTATADGGMAIVSQQVAGTAGATTGDMWTADTFGSDQFSSVQVTSTQLSGGQWVGQAVRLQGNGQNGYLGIYYWNNGSPELVLYKRTSGSWSQLGSPYSTGPLAAGTTLELAAVGDTVSFLENGVQRIGVEDSSFTGGAPGVMANGSGTADNWSGGQAGFQADYQSTDAQGVKYYDVISANDGYGPHVMRVLAPANPAPGVAHNFLIVLPVEAGLGTSYGDGLATLQALDAEDKYNLTIVEPSFQIDPWYANSSVTADFQYETFMTQELVPWIKHNLATTGNEQIWLLGFSKSGLGAQDLILKHPDLFSLAASWDFPADMSSYSQYTGSDVSYGTDANFQANYRLTASFVDAHKGPFMSNDRIWIGSYSAFQTDVSDYDGLLTLEGIVHNTETPQNMAHRWDSGWVPTALAALYQDSTGLH